MISVCHMPYNFPHTHISTRTENQLNKAIKPLSEGDIPTTNEPIVANGGILLKVQKWLGLKTEQVY